MKSARFAFKKLNATDLIVVVFCLLLSALNIVFQKNIETWHFNLLLNISITIYVVIAANMDFSKNNLIWRHLHYWYLVPLIFIFFKELYTIVDPIRGIIYDNELIEIDRILFGGDPTHFLIKITNPYLTELLQIVYATFFFLPVILGINLILTNKNSAFDYSAFIIVFGFILSFLGYLLWPAIGPRFTLHDFQLNNLEMPGILLTDYLREIVNSGESIPFGTPNPELIVQRDAFPSGHTQITLLVMYLSVKFNSNTKYFLIPNGSLLIFSTVYLRYHYVADLIGGAVFAAVTVLAGNYIYKTWNKYGINRETNQIP